VLPNHKLRIAYRDGSRRHTNAHKLTNVLNNQIATSKQTPRLPAIMVAHKRAASGSPADNRDNKLLRRATSSLSDTRAVSLHDVAAQSNPVHGQVQYDFSDDKSECVSDRDDEV